VTVHRNTLKPTFFSKTLSPFCKFEWRTLKSYRILWRLLAFSATLAAVL
jgi:hypothetical protein